MFKKGPSNSSSSFFGIFCVSCHQIFLFSSPRRMERKQVHGSSSSNDANVDDNVDDSGNDGGNVDDATNIREASNNNLRQSRGSSATTGKSWTAFRGAVGRQPLTIVLATSEQLMRPTIEALKGRGRRGSEPESSREPTRTETKRTEAEIIFWLKSKTFFTSKGEYFSFFCFSFKTFV